jgi:hypothetical protein
MHSETIKKKNNLTYLTTNLKRGGREKPHLAFE